MDRAASYLAAEADLSGLEPGDAEGMPLGNRWLQAQGFKLLLDSCEELNRSPSGPAVLTMLFSEPNALTSLKSSA